MSAAKRLADEAYWTLHQLVSLLPDSTLGVKARYWFYRGRLRSCGRFSSMAGAKIYAPERVSIGAGSSLSTGVIVDASDGGEIAIGEHVLIGPYSVLRAADHEFADVDKPIRGQGHRPGKIILEDGCWLGAHVMVKRGVTIGRGAVIGAHSMVTKDVPPFAVAVGVPARVVKSRAPKKP